MTQEEIIEQNYWESIRNQAAIAAMQGAMNFFGSIDYNREAIAKLAVEQADALIKEFTPEIKKMKSYNLLVDAVVYNLKKKQMK